MLTHYEDTALAFESCIADAMHLDRWARTFARSAHALRAAGKDAGAAAERHRAGVYRHKAHKRANAARRFLPH